MLITGSYCRPWLDAIFNIWAVLHIYHLKNYESWNTFAHRISGRGLRAWNVNDSCNIISLSGATGKLSFRHLPHPCPNFSPRSVRTGKKGHHMHALFNRNEGVFSCNKGKCIPFPGVFVGMNKKYWQSDPKHQRRPPFSHYGVYACTRAELQRGGCRWVRLEQTSPPCVCQDCTQWVRPSGPARSTGRGLGEWDLTWDRAWHTAKVQWKLGQGHPYHRILSFQVERCLELCQEVSPLDGVLLLMGELEGRSGNRPLCTVSLCQTLGWAWETHCVLLTCLSSTFTAAKLIMTWFHSLSDTSDTEGTLRKLGELLSIGFPNLTSKLRNEREQGTSSNKTGFCFPFLSVT